MIGFVPVKGFKVPLSSDDVGEYGFLPLPRERAPLELWSLPNRDGFYHSDCAKAGAKGLVNTAMNRNNQLIAAYCLGSGLGADWVYFYHPAL